MDNAARLGVGLDHLRKGRIMTQTDILIAGGGLNGASMALALARGGFDVTLVDPADPARVQADDFDGRAYALAHASVRMLRRLGVWEGLARETQPITGIAVSDGRPGEGASPLGLEFASAELEEGAMGHMIEDRYLRRALRAALENDAHVTLIDQQAVISEVAAPSTITATLGDGRTITARLLIAADGKESAIAQRAGIRRTGWRYGQTGLVCAIAHELPHEGVAHQLFTPAGPLGILPLPGNRCSIVWNEREKVADQINALDDEGYLAALRPYFGDFLGEISLAGARFAYPLRLSIAQSFTAPRTVLIGDAAHAVHPLAGQGLNAGLKDVAVLADVLNAARTRGEDIGAVDVLARYEGWRRFDVATLAFATDAINKLFSNDNPLLRVARDLGMAAVGRIAPLRRAAMREAAGLTGDLPELMRG